MSPGPSARGAPQPVLSSNAPNHQRAQEAFTSNGQYPAGSSACVICGKHHPSGKLECVDINQELSLRYALDDLRKSKASASDKQAVKNELSMKLKELQSKRQQ